MAGFLYAITAITTPATSNRLTTLPRVKDDLNIKTGDDDQFIGRLIDSQSDATQQYCNRVFAQQTYTLTLSPDFRPSTWQYWNLRDALMLSPSPLVSVASVTEDGVELVAGTDYIVDPGPPPPNPVRPGNLYRLDSNGNPRTWPRSSIVVVYTAGYTLPGAQAYNLPRSLEDAIIRLVKARYLSRDRDPLLKSENIPGVIDRQFWVDTGTDGNIPPDIREVLDQFRTPMIG